VREIVNADEKFPEKQKSLLQEVERSNDDVRAAKQQAKENLKELTQSNKELQKSVDVLKGATEADAAAGAGGGP